MCTIFAKCEEEGLIVGRSFDWVQFGGNICFEPSYRSYGVNTIGHCSIEQLGITGHTRELMRKAFWQLPWHFLRLGEQGN